MPTKDPFKISDHVADFAEISLRYAELSAKTLDQQTHQLDIPYGELETERLDLILPKTQTRGAPVHMFIHGGYWRAGSKADYSFIAEPIVAAGGIAVLADYSLMPQARMPDLVAQIRRAMEWVKQNIGDFGGEAERITVSGHSAGAHLASYLAASAPHEDRSVPNVKKLILVSGIYDLAPIPKSFLQAEIALTLSEVEHWSPINADHAPDVERIILVGGEETKPFHTQAEELRAILPGSQHTLRTLPGLDHMSIILEMGDPTSEAGRILADVVANS
ncbi:alpha/beta hydrolase [Pararhizobium sp. IMCC21322]|uniref:alpha/beta hydrolase n=1 Tax=Pararhizobium sp. IMCC21322 TaxID=3067903 RepID=UPI0027416C7A|nr:alpha/beta hydrolase [Pararhizobium sp. IMCC21322]